MTQATLYKAETDKKLPLFVEDLALAAGRRGFTIHNEDKMAMAHTFSAHGLEVGEDFDLHMIQICKPARAAQSLRKNPERAVLMPKFIMTFTRDGKTQIRFLSYARELVAALVEDDEFSTSLDQSFREIREILEEARK